MILPVFIDEEPYGEVFALIEDESGNIHLDARGVIGIFTQVLEPDAVKRLDRLCGPDGTIASRDLLGQGISVEFDQNAVVLNVHIDSRLRKKRRLNLHSHQQAAPLSANKAIRPASFSAALDLLVAQEWLQGERRPSSGELDAQVDMRGWVVQNRQVYNVDAERHWQRRETRLTRDWPDRWQRFSAGDLSYKSAGLMGNRPLSGLSLSTSFELQPYSVTYPLSRREFFLEQDSQVDVYINGGFQTRLQLPAGRHDILDLPLIQGVNQVTLEITDSMGRTRTLEFFEALEQRLLRQGLAEYSLTLGVPRSTDIQHGIDYETETPALSAFYRSGLSRNLTVGAHLEFSEEVAMGGASGIWNGLWGTLAYDVALSRDNDSDNTGTGGFADYLFRRQGWSVNTGYRWEARSFANLNQAAKENNTHHSARFGFTFPQVRGWFSSFSIGQNRRWEGDTHRSQRLSLNRSYPHGWRVSLDLSRQGEGDQKEFDASLRVYWAASGSRVQGSLGYASLDHARQAELRYQRMGELGLDARAFHLDSDRQRLDRMETSYVHPRLESRFAISQKRPDGGTSVDSQSLSFGTALAYADGHLALSRPLHGQPFVLLSGKASLGDQKVDVIRGLGNRPSAVVNGEGATAVLPNLSPYYVNEVKVDMRELPVGLQIERDSYSILPGYRSGVSVEVGVEGQIYLVGRFVDTRGWPLGYIVGRLLGPAEAPGEPILFFTDEEGHFEAAGVVSGRYRVQLDAPSTYGGELDVPEARFGRLEIGDIELERR